MKPQYLLAALCFVNFALSATILVTDRGLNDVFPGFGSPLPVETHAEQHTPERSTPVTPTPAQIVPVPLATSSISPTKSKDGASSQQRHESSISSSQMDTTTNLIIGTIPPLPSVTPLSPNQLGPTTVTPATNDPTPTMIPTTREDQSTSRSTQEWKIVGVAVIAFTSVAAILLLSVFFDHWWGFLRDLFWKKKRRDSVEELIPDWETASWDIRLGSDRHRYPSIPPVASIKQARLDLKRTRTFSTTENVAGIGSGLKSEEYSTLASRADQPNSPWTRGLGLSPLPQSAQMYQQPTGLPVHMLCRQDSKYSAPKTTPPSPALTDPYGGIAD